AGQTQQGPTTGLDANSPAQCATGFSRCMYPEDLFFDNTALLHVATLSALGPGKWFFDYSADKIYFADDPTGHKVETSVTTHAIRGQGAENVTIRGLTIEKYANPGQTGAVMGIDVSGWAIENNEIRLNHGTGAVVTSGSRNRIVAN